jgi:hypothetical protein
MLMDEQPDIGLGDVSTGDTSTLSFDSPVKTDSLENSFDLGINAEVDADDVDSSLVVAEEEDDEDEKTIVLPKPPPVSSPIAELAPPVPVPLPSPAANVEAPTPARQPKLRINSEMERIIVSFPVVIRYSG